MTENNKKQQLEESEEETQYQQTTKYETFRKCLNCSTYNKATSNSCWSCGLLFLGEATDYEIEEYNRNYQIENMILKED